MKLNTKMPKLLQAPYSTELSSFEKACDEQDYANAWHHIERAHIIGQRYPYQHTQTHWKMLLLGWLTGNFKEIVGQIMRLMLGAPFSFINKIPVGNVGSSRVSLVQSQELPEDLAELLRQLEN